MDKKDSIKWGVIVNRLSWLVIAVVLVFSLVVAIKILGLEVGTEIKINAESFLAFALALFSLLLSIMFYFKAEETSNKFYDNTYKFSADMSRLLAEVKSEFGEHLKNLDRGYEKIADAVTTTDSIIKPLEDTKKALESNPSSNGTVKTEDLKKQDLVQRVKFLQDKINQADRKISKVLNETSSTLRQRVLTYTRYSVIKKLLLDGTNPSDLEISKRFKELISDGRLPKKYVDDLKGLSFIDKDNYLSDEFLDYLHTHIH